MALSKMVESEVQRIQDLLSWRTIPTHARLWFKMEKSVVILRKEVEVGILTVLHWMTPV